MLVSTPVPTPATPTPELRAYLRRLCERILVSYAAILDRNHALLSQAAASAYDPGVLCESAGGGWAHAADLELELEVLAPPAPAAAFHQALLEALQSAERSARECDWLCRTYRELGDPAQGMWTRLELAVRSGLRRSNDLHAQWDALGGDSAGLVW
jgi:hypothetical protein